MSGLLSIELIISLIAIIFLAIGASIKIKETDNGFVRLIKNFFKLIFVIVGSLLLFVCIRNCFG